MITCRKRCKIETQLQWKTNRKSYVAYRMAPLSMTFSDVIGHICCSKASCLTYLRKYNVYCLWYVYILIGKRTWLVISTVFLKTKNFSKSQPVRCTVNVVISRKRCQIVSLLLQTTNRKWYMAYRIEEIPWGQFQWPCVTLRSFPTASLSMWLFVACRAVLLW